MNYEASWVDIVQTLWLIGTTIATIIATRDRETKLKLAQHETDIAALRLGLAEVRAGALSHDDLNEVHNKLNGMNENLAKLTGVVEGQAKVLERMARPIDTITEYLINHGQGRRKDD